MEKKNIVQSAPTCLQVGLQPRAGSVRALLSPLHPATGSLKEREPLDRAHKCNQDQRSGSASWRPASFLTKCRLEKERPGVVMSHHPQVTGSAETCLPRMSEICHAVNRGCQTPRISSRSRSSSSKVHAQHLKGSCEWAGLPVGILPPCPIPVSWGRPPLSLWSPYFTSSPVTQAQ